MRKQLTYLFIMTIALQLSSAAPLLAQQTRLPGPADQLGAGASVPVPVTVPRLIAFNGVLKDRIDRPLKGVIGLSFALYKDQEGGAPLWTEIQNLQFDDQGRYSVLLGATQREGVPIELFTSGESRWLGVQAQIPGEDEKTRVLLVSVPYALKAADADTLGGKPVSAFVLLQSGGQADSHSTKTLPQKATLKGGDTPETFSLSGTGTANRVVKWLDESGTLGDSSIHDNGNVGIGTTSPIIQSKLTVAGSPGSLSVTGYDGDWTQGGNRAFIDFAGGNARFGSASGGGSATGLHFVANNLLAMTINSSGNVGIAKTAPLSRLDVNGALTVQSGCHPAWTTNMLAIDLCGSAIRFQGGLNTVPIALAPAGGNVGIGTTAPAAKLDVQGGQINASGGLCIAGVCQTNGNSAVTRGITYLAGCDTCSVLADTDSQRTIYFNVVGPMMINSVTCFSDAGTPVINIQRDAGSGTPTNVLSSNLSCSASGTNSTSVVPSQSTLNLNEKLDFVMVSAGGVAKRVTVAIKATVN
ncbi:MAG: hypothetical protein DMG14_08555 [Acidobacteria bacterium]|nr:MAG: hypothetical protein DMG14_08555 [Acidobacteriota bacterium]